MFCVACDQWVLTEEQLASKLNAQRVNDSKTSSETSTPTPPPPASSAPACSPTMSLLGNATSTGGKVNGGSHGRISSLRDRDQDVEVRSPKRLASMEMFVGKYLSPFAYPRNLNLSFCLCTSKLMVIELERFTFPLLTGLQIYAAYVFKVAILDSL